MKRLGKTQHAVYKMLKDFGWWSPSAGWVWNGTRGTERIMQSLVRAGYATACEERGKGGWVYRPIERVTSVGDIIFLSDGTRVDGSNMHVMLNAQYKVLMKLSRRLAKVSGKDSPEQNMIADANILGLEVADRLKEL